MDIFNCKFQSYINTLSENKRFKYTIKNDMCLDILNVLKSKETNISPKFKFWVKETFHLVQTGSSESIYVTKRKLPLVTYENIFEKITECHLTNLIEAKYPYSNVVLEIQPSSSRIAGWLVCSHLVKMLFSLYNIEPVRQDVNKTNIDSFSSKNNLY